MFNDVPLILVACETIQVDKAHFAILCEYCAGLQGAARHWALKDARLIEERAAKLAKEAEEEQEEGKAEFLQREVDRMKNRKKRAGKMLAALSEDGDA
eukprot:1194727-Prorocentrum_minimum.AAC.2